MREVGNMRMLLTKQVIGFFFAATELKLRAEELMLSNCGAGEDS